MTDNQKQFNGFIITDDDDDEDDAVATGNQVKVLRIKNFNAKKNNVKYFPIGSRSTTRWIN